MENNKSLVILHRIPFEKVRYNQIIDHSEYDVTYITTNEDHDIPSSLRCNVIHVSPGELIEQSVCEILVRNIFVSRVIALSEYDLLQAEVIRSTLQDLGFLEVDPHRHPMSTFNCRDKRLMKDAAATHGVRMPKTFGKLGGDALECIQQMEKVVIKPPRGAASQDTATFRVNEDYYRIVSKLKSRPLEGAIVEEFIPGDIYHFDGFVVEGRVAFSVASKYIGNCLSFTSGQPLASIQLDCATTYKEWVENCIRAVGIEHGAFHLEGILSKDGLVFLEVANRAGGAGVVRCTDYLTGFHLMRNEVSMSVYGELLENAIVTPDRRFGWFVINEQAFSHDVTAEVIRASVSGIQELVVNKSVDSHDSVSYAEPHNACSGIVGGRDSKEVENRIMDILSLAATELAMGGAV